ncbi:C40 family peptidase [Microlunatus antarcticus]|uniref:Cell wall-associated NlpC family hydrolase n=1 Tax=Microlunatus antarcticus TaxID=53388 RepID=A0A7W5JYM9_9ACTN|nr:NlpC/P60 family protein [Microlunatus antarcticus]MBB3328668.1 cell wall-associated NlpC family hydrolase [Microlunatus antarcticus]
MRSLLTRVAVGTAVAAVSLGALVGTAAPASAAGCTTKFDTYATVKVGKTGSKARAVECLLHQAGYATSQNSSFSATDAKKLKAFQKKHAIKATGQTNGSTWAALIAQGSTPALEHGDTGASVRRLQLSLRALGHAELPGTTLYGDLTRAAVKDLQAKVGLAVTGTVSAAEWAALQAGGQAGSGGGVPVPVPVPAPAPTSPGETALAFAKEQLGEKYKYAAAGPDKWDCSGLTMKAWAEAGVTLPHNSAAQYKIGKKVKKADLQPGDLVFFYDGPSHVGIYAGDGQIIHAPKPGKTVTYIKVSSMPWKGARRPG